ncbi:PHR-2 [Rachiplusia nu nucleopolyhedrovirus]|uniref:Deoxyribodipyrimidine photo-lyase n=1 Tax=Rachiplusia nu nucleopolyhedrovirus TaxID=2605775 RepID=A0AAE6M5N6_9ABAC|nr:PHR-2 [Rachiplusia nu nucleopolyhedrovirus]QEI03609.1 PHR-2 [Rachiplusia nu nucleopolyhedrovirus]
MDINNDFSISRYINVDSECDFRRIRKLSNIGRNMINPNKTGGVVYWMSRDSRVQDNWAMIYAQELAINNSCPLYVVFCLTKKFEDAGERQFKFLLDGLRIVQKQCEELDITFVILGDSGDVVLNDWVVKYNISAVICDFNPLRTVRNWVERVVRQLPRDVYFAQVDAHNVVPCWVASGKQEYSARIFRCTLEKYHIKTYLKPFPCVEKHPFKSEATIDPATTTNIDWDYLLDSREVCKDLKPIQWTEAGYHAAVSRYAKFVYSSLNKYADHRNNPLEKAQSGLSPFLHFGQISAQRIILHVTRLNNDTAKYNQHSIDQFVEEIFIRRELADNYCFYNPNYDNLSGAPNWALKTIDDHKMDIHTCVYSLDELQNSLTHDQLWNCAQRDLVVNGKMHGYLRMYWAKKILEWSLNFETALSTTIYFNNRFSLDGRDPNGYVGIMWSICGLHDRGFVERPIYGKIRPMSSDGMRRKFKVRDYINICKFKFNRSIQ